MNPFIKNVKAFHQQFGVPILDTPQFPSENRIKLRIDLLQEELDELKEACEQKELTGVLDAACDTLYVLCGALLEFGLQGVFEAAYEEVQRSNMSKSCASLEEAEASQAYYLEHKGINTYIREVNGKWNVYNTDTHKVLKNINWKQPNLTQFITDENA